MVGWLDAPGVAWLGTFICGCYVRYKSCQFLLTDRRNESFNVNCHFEWGLHLEIKSAVLTVSFRCWIGVLATATQGMESKKLLVKQLVETGF